MLNEERIKDYNMKDLVLLPNSKAPIQNNPKAFNPRDIKIALILCKNQRYTAIYLPVEIISAYPVTPENVLGPARVTHSTGIVQRR